MNAQSTSRALDGGAVSFRLASRPIRNTAISVIACRRNVSGWSLVLGTVIALGLSATSLRAQESSRQDLPEHIHQRVPVTDLQDQDTTDDRLPNGKSQKDAIAKSEHEKALKDAEALIALSNQLKDEIVKAGTFVVPASALKKTAEIEKLARSVRGHVQIYSNLSVK